MGLNAPDSLEFVFCEWCSLFCDGVAKVIDCILFVLKLFGDEPYVVVLGSLQDLGHNFVMLLFCCSCHENIIYYLRYIFDSREDSIDFVLEDILGDN